MTLLLQCGEAESPNWRRPKAAGCSRRAFFRSLGKSLRA